MGNHLLGPIHVVKPRDPRPETVILVEIAAHTLGKQLFPALALFRHRRVRILFFQRTSFKRYLFIRVVQHAEEE